MTTSIAIGEQRKAILIPSFLASFNIVIMVLILILLPRGLTIELVEGLYLLFTTVFVIILLERMTSNREFGRRMRNLFLGATYKQEMNRIIQELGLDNSNGQPRDSNRVYTVIFETEMEDHMRTEVEKIESDIFLSSNLTISIPLLLVFNIVFLVLSFPHFEILIPSYLPLIVLWMLFLAVLFYLSYGNWRDLLKELNSIYIDNRKRRMMYDSERED